MVSVHAPPPPPLYPSLRFQCLKCTLKTLTMVSWTFQMSKYFWGSMPLDRSRLSHLWHFQNQNHLNKVLTPPQHNRYICWNSLPDFRGIREGGIRKQRRKEQTIPSELVTCQVIMEWYHFLPHILLVSIMIHVSLAAY